MCVIALSTAGCQTMPKSVQDKIEQVRSYMPPMPSVAAPSASASDAEASYGNGYTQPYLEHPTPAEKRMQEQAARTRAVVMGGIVQSILTRAPFLLLACQNQYAKKPAQRNRCVAVVFLITGLKGASEGYTVATLEESKNNKLEAARKVTKDMTADNLRLQEMVETTDALLTESQARLVQVTDDLQAKRITKDDADRERAANAATIKIVSQRIADAKQTRDEYAKSVNDIGIEPTQRRDIDAQVANMNKTITTLEAREKQLRAVMSPVPL